MNKSTKKNLLKVLDVLIAGVVEILVALINKLIG